MKGPLHRFFAADHRRLDGLLRSSISEPGPIDLGPFGEFRAGLLKHIGMELKAYNDGPEVLKHIEARFELARRQWLDDEGRL